MASGMGMEWVFGSGNPISFHKRAFYILPLISGKYGFMLSGVLKLKAEVSSDLIFEPLGYLFVIVY